jgi:hypothetical protein
MLAIINDAKVSVPDTSDDFGIAASATMVDAPVFARVHTTQGELPVLQIWLDAEGFSNVASCAGDCNNMAAPLRSPAGEVNRCRFRDGDRVDSSSSSFF